MPCSPELRGGENVYSIALTQDTRGRQSEATTMIIMVGSRHTHLPTFIEDGRSHCKEYPDKSPLSNGKTTKDGAIG